MIFDSGKHWLADMGNAGGEALGWINFQTAFAMSDNVYFYEMGRRAGIENLNAYAAQYGFGRPTGIELAGESSGLIAGPSAKKKVFNEDWTLGDTFNAAIGQGLTLVTPTGGTGAWFAGLPVPVAGKTGTAENPHGQDHGWFIAYAPAEKPDLVIACIVEQGSYGATASGPVVYEVLEDYLTGKLKAERK